MIPGWRAKLAATIVLFFVGLFGGRLADLVHAVGGKVEEGRRVTDQIRATVTTIDLSTAGLEAQIADLQARLAAGTATPAQIDDLKGLLARLKPSAGPPGPQGQTGATGATGPPGPAVAAAPTTTTTTSPLPATTSTTRTAPTTTTRCILGVGRLARIGC